MDLVIRYEGEIQHITLDLEESRQLCICLDVDGDFDESPEGEAAGSIQEAFDEKFNRPEYNVFHRETRHIDRNPKPRRMDGKIGYIKPEDDDPAFNPMEYLAVHEDKHTDLDYEEVCKEVRRILADHPEWAEIFIAVELDDMTVKGYAKKNGLVDNSVTKKLVKARGKLAELWVR